MSTISRKIAQKISKKLFRKRAVIILGPRQSGKTTFVKNLIDTNNLQSQTRWFNGDEADIRALFQNATSTKLKAVIGDAKYFVIDEAQRIENIGLVLKLIIDNISGVQIIATGSSSFDLANKINEPLTGRKFEYFMFPFSISELTEHFGLLEERRLLENRLVFGTYPEVVLNDEDKVTILKELADSYLYKDILVWDNIKKSEKVEKLLQALALQVGNEVSYTELGQIVGIDNETVERYIQILEKSFIIFRYSSLKRNLRSELKRSKKIYFYDNGIRNAVINNFNLPELRNDIGALWENFLISERLKYVQNNEIYTNRFFWRTYAQQEIDYIEEREGKLFAYEFKWGNKKKKPPKTFMDAYPDSEFEVINRDNYEKFIGVV